MGNILYRLIELDLVCGHVDLVAVVLQDARVSLHATISDTLCHTCSSALILSIIRPATFSCAFLR